MSMTAMPDRAGRGSPELADAAGPPEAAGYELPLLLLSAFRGIIDELHAQLAREGHPELRPAHGFTMQAIGIDGATATEVGRRLGISKQAAGKTIDRLTELGYADRFDDPADGRRKLIRLTPRGIESLARSAAIFARIRADLARQLGPDRLRQFEADLRAVVPAEGFRLDVAGWFGG
jgi:DNA-binding MarR family transcriptional regulator